MKTKVHNLLLTLLLAAGLTAAGCADPGERTEVDTDTAAVDTSAVMADTPTAAATLQPTQGNNVRGTVTFTEVGNAVRVVANVSGLGQGPHGFHVHEFGDCSAPDASSAGGHFAPQGSPHGSPDDPPDQRHVGDLGNIEAPASGQATYTRIDSVITLSGPNSIVGKAVVVHADEDDLASQPSGDAGARLACGVIEMQQGAGAGMGTPTPGTPQDTTMQN